jgi:two-component system alkaline phosphatase synthesis response regulator PhoP
VANEHILVIDDEEDILELLRYNLVKQGYQVSLSTSGEQGLAQARQLLPDLIVLDLMLPGIDGLDVCKALKLETATRQIPIIMITAKGDEADIVTGLELGAEDYIVKPFSPRVVTARVKNVLRRKRGTASDSESVLRIEDLVIDSARHEVTLGGTMLELTSTEFKLLRFLASQRGFVFTRDQIVDRVHGEDYPVTDRSVDVQIVGLRRKLGAFGAYIETVRGVGYRFKG